MQRIVFVNLHSDWMLLKTMSVYLWKFSAAVKHGYLLKYLLDHPEEYEVCNFINDRGFSSFRSGNPVVLKFFNLFSGLENRITLKVNGIRRSQIKILRTPGEIKSDDIIVSYYICADTYRQLEQVNAFKALSLIHFGGNAQMVENVRKAGINYLFCEVDLSKTSEIYRRYYDVGLPIIVHPFVPAQRFKKVIPFCKRKNKCFSVGTITYRHEPGFIEIYKDPCLQPARKFVKDNVDYFAGTVDCYSQNYQEEDNLKAIKSTDFKIVKFLKKVHNHFYCGQQKKYYSFDMVQKFNEYKMCLIGEEVIGVPGIGFVEGMACGTAYIGIDSPMYRDYGLIPGVHYITYDGTKEGLKRVVQYYQQPEHQDELERIANAGYEFVRDNFCGSKVATDLLSTLVKLKEQRHNI